ncbi:hypothetical protein Nepgr_016715 [Nepenthes gracilis]|uniref:ZF-HD dimerization-type domain-containing protein n=1 Tax=Nepenthes gracilis TaxID=150966 RepID=A0AAD3SQ72_NEPGR|nr:hypothetical protein Nepgr_016715 [Nepenthes gracilis]
MKLKNQHTAMEMRSSFSYAFNSESLAKLTSIASERGGAEEAGFEERIFTPISDHHHHDLHPHNQERHPEAQNPSSNLALIPAPRRSNSDLNNQQDTTHPTAGPAPAHTSSIRYQECQKNHAAHLGGHVVDGCGEFMPSGEEGTPESFRCAACDCHRNFHRKEADGETLPHGTDCHLTYNSTKSITQGHVNITSASQPAPPTLHQPPHPQSHHQHQRVSPFNNVGPVPPLPPTMMSFGGGAPAESSSEDLNIIRSNTQGQPSEPHKASQKRFRTKFTQQQKDKMMQFADKLGWRILKQDDVVLQHFCDEVGVKRQAFKVWMHNNKQAMKRKQS